MKLRELSTAEIKRTLKANEKLLGPDAFEVQVYRQELIKRRKKLKLKNSEMFRR